MSEIQFAGVKNTSGAAVKVTHGGITREFAADEINVLDAGYVQFLLSRNHITSDGKLVMRKFLFQSVPLTEALKHVKEPENRSIAEAKKAAAAKEKERADMKAEILAELKEDGRASVGARKEKV